jgi:hypothetical protein
MNGAALTTDANGQFDWPGTVPPEAPLDIDAPGFLPHRTRLFAVPSTNQIPLWPAANEAEAAAIQAMAFFRVIDGFSLHKGVGPSHLYQLAVVVEKLPHPPPGIFDDWSREYEEIRALTGRALSLTSVPRGDGSDFDGEVVVMFDEAEECKDIWGFCDFVGHDGRLGWFSRPYRMSVAMAERPGVIKRLLAFGLLKANPLPGLLNKTAPATELSLLEKQTLKMQSIRPVGTRWPDTAPVR